MQHPFRTIGIAFSLFAAIAAGGFFAVPTQAVAEGAASSATAAAGPVPVQVGEAAPSPSAAGDDALDADQVKTIVRDLIAAEPEIVIEAIKAFQAAEQQRQIEAASQAVLVYADAIFQDAADPVLGNPDGDVTIVEFFDYRCGYCKKVQADIEALIEKDGNIRFIAKEFPILGPESLFAAKVALASVHQDKYGVFHSRLMSHKGSYGEDAVYKLAAEAGLDVERLKADLKAHETDIKAHIDRVLALAETLQVNGTPAFIFGNTLVPGAIDGATMEKLVAEVRASQAAQTNGAQ